MSRDLSEMSDTCRYLEKSVVVRGNSKCKYPMTSSSVLALLTEHQGSQYNWRRRREKMVENKDAQGQTMKDLIRHDEDFVLHSEGDSTRLGILNRR